MMARGPPLGQEGCCDCPKEYRTVAQVSLGEQGPSLEKNGQRDGQVAGNITVPHAGGQSCLNIPNSGVTLLDYTMALSYELCIMVEQCKPFRLLPESCKQRKKYPTTALESISNSCVLGNGMAPFRARSTAVATEWAQVPDTVPSSTPVVRARSKVEETEASWKRNGTVALRWSASSTSPGSMLH
uniref:Uncharacterized protein n=1 Tax=Timema genevievae TaxID=629358 RepID=A0A7R9PKJ7_TIMGE|nr:unnamed protein product [Timema genevievae]